MAKRGRPTKKKAIIAAKHDNPDLTTKELSDKFGVSRRTIRRIIANDRNGKNPQNNFEKDFAPVADIPADPSAPKVSQDFSKNKGSVSVNSFTIHTLEQALEVADVDLDKWEVDRWVCNSWGVTMKDPFGRPASRTNYQVKVWLKAIKPDPVAEAMDRFVERVPTFTYSDHVPKFTAPTGLAAEIAPVDVHLGKLCWSKEIGREDYDLKVARDKHLKAVDHTCGWIAPWKPEKIYYIMGQDLMHIENLWAKTPMSGHVLDTDSRFAKIFDTAFETTLKSIYMCRAVAPTEVILIPGNHDLHASRGLCLGIEQHFKDDEYVQVDMSPRKRKARLWGDLLVGWTHEVVGKPATWMNELADEFPKLWGQSKLREWHHGHKHKKQEIQVYSTATTGRVTLRQFSALSEIDYWHYDRLFTDAVPGLESCLWDKKHGVFNNFVAWSDAL